MNVQGMNMAVCFADHQEERPIEVSAVLFDMADVLYDATVWRRWLLQLLSHLGLHTHYDVFYRVWDRQHYYDVCRGRSDLWESLADFLGEAGLSKGQVGEVIAAARPRREHFLKQARPFPGVAATLSRLAAGGATLAVFDNDECSGAELQNRLDNMGLGHYFSHAISSCDAGHAKPDKAAYLAATAALDLPTHAVALVSHDETDLCSARQLGMTTIATRHAGQVDADKRLTCFSELVNVVEVNQSRRLAG